MNSFKRILSAFMALCLCSFCFSFYAFASSAPTADIEKTQLGTGDTYYSYSVETKTLTIEGTGATPDFSNTSTSIPWYLWRSDGSIENVVIKDGVTALGNYLLYQVKTASITLPDTLKQIRSYALGNTLAVTDWVIPFGVTSIGTNAFYGCSTMESITLPDTLVSIGSKAFYNCTSLDSITIPYSVTTIGSNAFYQCTSLNNVVFQSETSSVSISSNCFLGCSSLKNITVPMNATVGTKFFGYADSSTKYTDVTMNVYSGSNGQTYADTNGFAYTVTDITNAECAVEYKNTYDDNNVNRSFDYLFTADRSIVYNFYTRGDCDVSAVLKDSAGNTVASNDDISSTDKNFIVSAQLEKDSEYILTVSSYKSTGTYSLWIYPQVINTVNVKGGLTFNACDSADNGEYRCFDITDALLSDFIFTIKFENGLQDMLYYQSGYFDNRNIAYNDTQSENPFTCGSNTAQISVGEINADFEVLVNHSYTQSVIDPTVDDDGYTLNTCVLCSDSYKDNFVPTTAVTVSGRAVLAQRPDMSHTDNIAYPYVSFYANGREYTTDSNGCWSFNTFDSCDITFVNRFGSDVTVHFDVNGENVDYGDIAFVGYDFNKDSHVNVKDFAIYARQYRNRELSADYWQYAKYFL